MVNLITMRLVIFFLLLSNFVFAQNKITLTVPRGSSGGVSNVSVNSANGFGGSVTNPTTTPAISITTNQTGLLYGNGTSVTGTKISNDFSRVNDSLFMYLKANVLNFGAVPDGVTNNTAAFQAAVNTGLPVYVPSAGTFLLSTSVTLQPGQLLYGDGFGSIIKITANTRAIVMDSAARVTGIKFVGNGKAGSGSFNTGISLSGSPGAQVDNCLFTDFAGDPVNNGGGGIFGSVIFTSASDGARILNNYFLSNDCGLNLPTRAEYVTVDGNTFGDNTCAILAIAGNTIISNNIIQNNVTAIKVLDGTNNAHSIIANNLINHNVYPYWFEDVDFGNGMSVEGNDCFYGGVVFINVSNLRINGDVWHHMDSIHLDNTSFISFNGGYLGEDIGTTTPIPVSKYNGAEDIELVGVTRSDIASPGNWIKQIHADTVTLAGPMYHTGLTSDVGDKAVRYNTTTKRFTYADTTTGGGSQNLNTTLTNGDDISSSYTTSTGANTWTISTANSGTNPFAVTSTTGNALALNATTGNALNAIATGSNAVSSMTKHTTSTNDISDGLNLLRTTTGTAAVGLGNRISLWGQTSTGAMAVQGYMETAWTNATNGAQSSTLYLKGAKAAAVTDYLTIDGTDVDFEGQSLTNYISKYNNQTNTTYTLLASDAGKIVTFDNAADITLTVPTGLPVGFTCTIIQLGAGEVIFTASSTTINNRGGFDRTNGPYAMATITQMATSTFITGGDMQ